MTMNGHSTELTNGTRDASAEDAPPDIMVTNDNSTRTFTGAEFLVHALVSAGVTHVFGGHGGAVVPLIDAIMAHPSIEWVYCRCEVNASQAAAAYAKLHGTLGCCVATSGPGAGHLLSGLVDADQDRVPLLCITGMKDTGHIRYADFQDIDQAAIFRMAGLPLSETVADIHQLLPLTRNAFTMSLASNRCTHLAIPINVQQDTIVGRAHFCLGTAFQSRVTTPAPQLQVDALAMALRTEFESKRHVVIACGYRAHAVGHEVERLAELLHCPILTSFDGKGTVDENHPLAYGVVGVYGNAGTPSAVDLLQDCDTIIGICLNDMTELLTNKSGLQIRRLIQIDERLVAGDSLRFSPSTVFSCGYLRESLGKVVHELEQSVRSDPQHHLRLNTLQKLRLSREKSDAHDVEIPADVWGHLKGGSMSKPTGTPSTYLQGKCIEQKDVESTEYCHPAVFFDVMAKHLDEDSIICADIGDNALWLASSLAAERGQRFLSSEHLGIMGYAINSGLAASLSAAKKGHVDGESTPKTLIVAGDGGIQMSLNELATLKDHGAQNVLVVVIVNKRLGRVQNETWGPRVRADGCHVGSPDFVKLFDAYSFPNGSVLSTSNPEVIAETIEASWNSAKEHGCCVIEIVQDEHVHPVMHKLSIKHQPSLVPWESLNRNPENDSMFPSIKIGLDSKVQENLSGWLDVLDKVVLSSPLWLNHGDLFSKSPSVILETLLCSLPLSNDDVFPCFEIPGERNRFDSQYFAALLNALPDDILANEVTAKGTSNSHPLKFQCLACPKGFEFKLHAHPSVELIVPLVGELWERRLIGATMASDHLKRDVELSVPAYSDKLYEDPNDDDIAKAKENLQSTMSSISSLGTEGKFVDRPTRAGQVLYNAVGSIHQSYTKEEGCLLFVLWSGIHADFVDCECCRGIEGADLFLP